MNGFPTAWALSPHLLGIMSPRLGHRVPSAWAYLDKAFFIVCNLCPIRSKLIVKLSYKKE